ncbi:hypothetical protein ASPZODRAFT_1529667 [Penicilliopsis zonata CBS 506.65]|uniref:Uncharacterized protein n=1 Tax=Penicilliopsis zonata CBS 506.65 TaxID=1073090 RepID=A0A1L9SLR3_9EURO|nr:hypothetical protein ASPZODRAFT_1529667 [Penicilliopsis zonata CBS 506.65]OJJ48155.1 hypothetical protein ASPZODRAFT_1529667 [Penicilliopsis zonata CBS 506.65]
MASPFQANDLRTNMDNQRSESPNGGKPISFKTNVNRAKTKRWVEAKKYSYDGNDWGDDEYDEYDNDPPAPPVPAIGPTSSNATAPASAMSHPPRSSTLPLPSQILGRPAPMSAMDRSRSFDHIGSTLKVEDRGGRSQSAEAESLAESRDTKPLPFIRPADIYKRMREEKERQNSSASQSSQPVSDFPAVDQPSGPGIEPQAPPPPVALPVQDTMVLGGSPLQQSLVEPSPSIGGGESEKAVQNVARDAPTLGTPSVSLPPVQPLGSFSADFFGNTGSNAQTSTTTEPQPLEESGELHHRSSSGFRSVVHQAFDAQTPTSTTESVVRSNSDGTSIISPIIGHRGFSDDKTPTIPEEPGEIGNALADFKPGHRRDLSLPSSENSPSRRPVITESEKSHQSELAVVDLATPGLPPQDGHESSLQQGHELTKPELPVDSEYSSRGRSQQPHLGASEIYLPPPLRLNSSVSSDPDPDNAHDQVPVVVQSISTDTSPQDTENDRLRREIIMSLSRENSPSYEPQPGPQSELDARTAGDQGGNSASDAEKHDVPPLYSKSLPSIPPPTTESDQSTAPRPKLERRFSWESSGSEASEPVPDNAATSPSVDPSLNNTVAPSYFPTTDGESLKPVAFATSDESTSRPSTREKPQLTILPPAPINESTIEAIDPKDIRGTADLDGSQPQQEREVPAQAPLVIPISEKPLKEPTILGFRDIVGIQSSEERVRAFDRTRGQFAATDTGLNDWIQSMLEAYPEYADVIEQSQNASTSAYRPTTAKPKFPKLPSLSNFTSLQDGSSSSPGHVRRSSAPLGAMMNRQNVEQRGKELLHTAGVLGGKGREAAKGLFAKGKSKFRGGNDKVLSSSPGARRSLQISDRPVTPGMDSDSSLGKNRPRRSSLHFASLPIFKRTGTSETLDWPSAHGNSAKDRLEPVAGSGSRDPEPDGSFAVEQSINMEEALEQHLPTGNTAAGTVEDSGWERRQESSSVPPGPSAAPPALDRSSPTDDLSYAADLREELVAALRLLDSEPVLVGVHDPGDLEPGGRLLVDTESTQASTQTRDLSDSQADAPATESLSRVIPISLQVSEFDLPADCLNGEDQDEEYKVDTAKLSQISIDEVTSQPTGTGDGLFETNSDNSGFNAEKGLIAEKSDYDQKPPNERSNQVEQEQLNGSHEEHQANGTVSEGVDHHLLSNPIQTKDTTQEERITNPSSLPSKTITTPIGPKNALTVPSTRRFYLSAINDDNKSGNQNGRAPPSPTPPKLQLTRPAQAPPQAYLRQYSPPKPSPLNPSLHQVPSISSLGTVRGRQQHRPQSSSISDLQSRQSADSAYDDSLRRFSMTQVSLPSDPGDWNHRQSPLGIQGLGTDAHTPAQRSDRDNAWQNSPKHNTPTTTGTQGGPLPPGGSSPHSDSVQSADSTRVHANTSRIELVDAIATPVTRSEQPVSQRATSAMGKLKNISKLHRISLGSAPTPTTSKNGQKKKGLGRFSGIFNRPTTQEHLNASGAPVSAPPPKGLPPSQSYPMMMNSQPTTYPLASPQPPAPPFASQGHQPRSRSNSGPFLGQPPPLQGYYAPPTQVPPSGHFSTEKQLEAGMGYNDMSMCQSSVPQRLQQRVATQPVNHPQQPMLSEPQPNPRRASMPLLSAMSPNSPPAPFSRGQKIANALSFRPQNPKPLPPPPTEQPYPRIEVPDPAHNPGALPATPPSQHLGGQERQQNDALPTETSTQASKVEQTIDGPGFPKPRLSESDALVSLTIPEEEDPSDAAHSHLAGARALNEPEAPVELPATADDSSEEIVMTSTAYPGQEWRPSGFSSWEQY